MAKLYFCTRWSSIGFITPYLALNWKHSENWEEQCHLEVIVAAQLTDLMTANLKYIFNRTE